MLSSHQIIKKTPDSVGKIIGNEAVVILPEQGEVKVLNEVGARIWELADGSWTVAELVNIINDEYDISADQAEKDILDFIQLMVDKKLFIVVD